MISGDFLDILRQFGFEALQVTCVIHANCGQFAIFQKEFTDGTIAAPGNILDIQVSVLGSSPQNGTQRGCMGGNHNAFSFVGKA